MRILLFAHLRGAAGREELHLDCDGVDADTLWARLVEASPALERFRGSIRLARNSEFASPETRFFAGDEVALIPPVSGG